MARLNLLTTPLLLLVAACEESSGPHYVAEIDPPRQPRLSSDWVKNILRDDSTLLTWGPGFAGTLGQGDLTWHDTPQVVPNLSRVISYVQGYGTALALTANGDLYFWGNNITFAEPPGQDTIVVVPTRVGSLEGAVSLDYGVVRRIHFIRNDGSMGRVTHDPSSPTTQLIPEELSQPNRVVQVSQSLGLYADGTLFTLYYSEQDYGGLLPGLDSIAAVQNIWSRRTVYLKLDGTVWGWGQNGCGELGNGSNKHSATPVRVLGLSEVIQISATYDFNLALKEDGTVWFWGFRGRDDNDELVCQTSPVQVPGIANAVDIYAAYESLIQTEAGEYFVFSVHDYSVAPVPVPSQEGSVRK